MPFGLKAKWSTPYRYFSPTFYSHSFRKMAWIHTRRFGTLRGTAASTAACTQIREDTPRSYGTQMTASTGQPPYQPQPRLRRGCRPTSLNDVGSASTGLRPTSLCHDFDGQVEPQTPTPPESSARDVDKHHVKTRTTQPAG